MPAALPARTPVVLDTSVIIKWFRQGEVLADRALVLRDAYLEGRIAVIVPMLVAYELANVLRFKTDLTLEQVRSAAQSLFDLSWDWAAPSSTGMGRAVEIARAHGVTVHDATFAALAESVHADLITADERLVRRLSVLSFVHCLGDLARLSGGVGR
jgi:predicted nucleic acid-binding protein